MENRSAVSDWLLRRSVPRFGQLALIVTLICGAALLSYFLTQQPDPGLRGERLRPVTPFSWLPDDILLSLPARQAFGAAYALGGLLWLTRRLLPVSPWLTVLGFWGGVGLYIESATQLTHVAHATAMMLLLHAVWYAAVADDIRAADRAGAFWTTPLYPNWAHLCGVFYLGLLYGFSGWMKVLTSGIDWPNGVSMQLWVNLWGDRDSVWTRLALQHRWVAVALQWAALVAECAAPLALVPRLRPWIGLALIGFHYGQVAVFGWGFHANAALIALYFLPVRRWVRG